jgi:hypothetical protein
VLDAQSKWCPTCCPPSWAIMISAIQQSSKYSSSPAANSTFDEFLQPLMHAINESARDTQLFRWLPPHLRSPVLHNRKIRPRNNNAFEKQLCLAAERDYNEHSHPPPNAIHVITPVYLAVRPQAHLLQTPPLLNTIHLNLDHPLSFSSILPSVPFFCQLLSAPLASIL